MNAIVGAGQYPSSISASASLSLSVLSLSFASLPPSIGPLLLGCAVCSVPTSVSVVRRVSAAAASSTRGASASARLALNGAFSSLLEEKFLEL